MRNKGASGLLIVEEERNPRTHVRKRPVTLTNQNHPQIAREKCGRTLFIILFKIAGEEEKREQQPPRTKKK